jgi:hypothetical protein
VVDEGRALAIADDEAGTRGWLTPEETERAAKEAAQAAAAGERVAKEAAQARAERLAAMLRALGMDPETSS